MTWAYGILILVSLQRVTELMHARRNNRQLITEGGREIGAAHYPLFVLLHGGWLLALVLRVDAETTVDWTLIAAFLTLQAGRLWVMMSLGRFWTTRIITLPQAPLVRRGPYRWIRHPNYLIVALEIPLLPLALGDWQVAAVFTPLNLVLLWWRIRIEDGVLAERAADTVPLR